MRQRYDWARVREFILSAVTNVEHLLSKIGKAHLQPHASPEDVIAIIDDLDQRLDAAKADLSRARDAATASARRALTIAGSNS